MKAPRSRRETFMDKRKINQIRKAVVISLISLLALLLAVIIGVGAYALSLYSKMTFAEKGDSDINPSMAIAAELLESGVPLDQILKDEVNFRFTMQDINELKQYYMEWISSQTGDEDTDTSQTIDQWKDPPADEPLPEEAAKLINILLLGTDERVEGVRGRADVIIAVTINTERKTITLTSILRDTYLKLAGTDSYGKINSAYALGGVSAVQNTIYDYFGLEFDNYVRVNFGSFEKVIDAIGGIDMELSPKEISNLISHTKLDGGEVFDPAKYKVEGTENTYHLKGKFALRYCRDRYANDAGQGDGDFGRTERQRRVLKKIIEKAQSRSFGELTDFIPVVLPMVTTDLTVADCTNLLASVGTSYKSYKINIFRVPANGTWSYERINGVSVLGVNFAENKKLLHELLFGK